MLMRESVPLAPLTTLGVGGPARYFAECRTDQAVADALAFAQERGLPVLVLGGGSNVVMADAGWPGLVVHVAITGVDFAAGGEVTCAAGEPWDRLVAAAVARGWSGIECLSGIPGTVGAAPIQNIGAYGQEIAETLVTVECLDRARRARVTFDRAACGFGYRTSRFKTADRDRYVVLAVRLRLQPEGAPTLRYAELAQRVGSGPADVARVRATVLALRRGKSMLLDPADPNGRSAGSFFLNPVLSPDEFTALRGRWAGSIPTFPADGGVKVPAAWLVEQAGFTKGTRRGGVGISTRHALALVNHGDGTARDLLALAEEIAQAVWQRFGIRLAPEPVVIGDGAAAPGASPAESPPGR